MKANLRLLRIGFEPMEAGTFSLAHGEVYDATFTLHENRIRLATFDVKASARCQVQPTGAQLVTQLFQQARTALIASTTPLNGTASARSVAYARQQSRRGKLLVPLVRSQTAGETVRPYVSIGVDSLEKVGYVVADGPDFNYFAPDAEVLLSDTFLARHCLQLVNGTDSLAGSIGIGFRPVVNRTNYVDIQGTLWLNQSTNELQFLEYTYTQLPDYEKKVGLGGRVEYAQLPNGGWFVNKWYIRMPILTLTSMTASLDPRFRDTHSIEVSGLQIAGGEVQDIRVGDRVLYLNSNAERAGELPGDAADALVTTNGGDGLPLNSDATTFASLCGRAPTFGHEGLVTGRVVDESRAPFGDAVVKAEWQEQFLFSKNLIQWQDRELSTTSSSAGSYRLCGIPTSRTVSVFASRTTKRGTPSFVQVTASAPLAQLTLQLAAPPY